METRWWIWVEGAGALGPITELDLYHRCRDRVIDPATCVWAEELATWIPLKFINWFRGPLGVESDSTREWYGRDAGTVHGPLTLAELWLAIATGELPLTAALSHDQKSWIALRDESEVSMTAELQASPRLDEIIKISEIAQRPHPWLAQPAEQRFGNYELLAPLGVGGMGEVFAARVTIGEKTREVALKRIRADLVVGDDGAAFLDEARILLGLRHMNIISVLDVGIVAGRHYVAMELANGGSVQSAIQDRSLYAKGVGGLLEVAIDAAVGLDFVHSQGHVHQDVKSANLLIHHGTTKVSDFGLCKTRRVLDHRPAADIFVTARGMTAAYASPEQTRAMYDASIKLAPSADVWSWAVTVLEMFAGQVAWRTGHAAPHFLESMLSEPTELPKIPPAVVDLLRECFARDPERRPTLRDAAERLRALQALDGDRATPERIAAVAGGLPAPRSVPLPVVPTSALPPPHAPVAAAVAGGLPAPRSVTLPVVPTSALPPPHAPVAIEGDDLWDQDFKALARAGAGDTAQVDALVAQIEKSRR